ncbi:hypothetical protein T439DRAFT_346390 [Meredithblackwellia eburnea MCA 4105]
MIVGIHNFSRRSHRTCSPANILPSPPQASSSVAFPRQKCHPPQRQLLHLPNTSEFSERGDSCYGTPPPKPQQPAWGLGPRDDLIPLPLNIQNSTQHHQSTKISDFRMNPSPSLYSAKPSRPPPISKEQFHHTQQKLESMYQQRMAEKRQAEEFLKESIPLEEHKLKEDKHIMVINKRPLQWRKRSQTFPVKSKSDARERGHAHSFSHSDLSNLSSTPPPLIPPKRRKEMVSIMPAIVLESECSGDEDGSRRMERHVRRLNLVEEGHGLRGGIDGSTRPDPSFHVVHSAALADQQHWGISHLPEERLQSCSSSIYSDQSNYVTDPRGQQWISHQNNIESQHPSTSKSTFDSNIQNSSTDDCSSDDDVIFVAKGNAPGHSGAPNLHSKQQPECGMLRCPSFNAYINASEFSLTSATSVIYNINSTATFALPHSSLPSRTPHNQQLENQTPSSHMTCAPRSSSLPPTRGKGLSHSGKEEDE